ncbi:MAG: polysaccharide deacetylase family protein [Hyphomicrobiaceae bacterium]
MKTEPTPMSEAAARARRQSTLPVAALLLMAASGIGGIAAFAQSVPGNTGVTPARAMIANPQTGGAGSAQAGLQVPKPTAKPAPKRAAPVSAKGCGSAGAIGVVREQAIDASTGPRYGHQQFKDIEFLQDGEVVLTFDDGPLRPYTVPVLKALEAHCTKATFFVVGRMALSDPALVRETAKRGHTIGTHTWSHMDVRKTSQTRARGEIELGVSAVSKALGQPVSPFFRFPYLSSPKPMLDYLRSRKIGVFSIEVDSNDYRSKDPAHVYRNVLSQLEHKKKGIILFHDIQPATAGALGGLLDELKARGFKVVHMTSTAQVTTLPEFDAIADKEMARKSTIASADPLASRSIVWPMAGGEAAQKAAGKVPAPAAEPEEMLPWGVVATKPAPITTSAVRPKPAPQPSGDFDWATKLFNF